MAIADSPYPFREGKFVVERTNLPLELKRVLAEAERLDALAKESRRLADRWEKEDAQAFLVEGRRRLAGSSAFCRDVQAGRLWSFFGLRPPPGLRYNQLRIVG